MDSQIPHNIRLQGLLFNLFFHVFSEKRKSEWYSKAAQGYYTCITKFKKDEVNGDEGIV